MEQIKPTWADRILAGRTLTEIMTLQRALGARLATELDAKDAAHETASQLDSIYQYEEAAIEYREKWGKMQGVSSGYASIDQLTHGFVGGELVVLGGYTSRGKTQLAINITHRLAHKGLPVLFVTLEMTKAMLTSRFMRLGEIGADTPIFFQSQDAIEPEDLAPLIGRAKSDGCQFVVIDHLHYFARGDNMLGKVGEVTRAFKRLAVEYNLPILLLSQLSRPDKAKRVGRLDVPSLNDLKESSYIEQDADIVLMIHRDLPDDNSSDPDIDPSLVYVVQRKNRNRGMIGSQRVQLRHDASNGVVLSEPSPAFPTR